MGANILWEPVKAGQPIDCSTPSATIRALEDTFGSLPVTLEPKHAFALRAMAKAAKNDTYERLAALAEEHDGIRVWADY